MRYPRTRPSAALAERFQFERESARWAASSSRFYFPLVERKGNIWVAEVRFK